MNLDNLQMSKIVNLRKIKIFIYRSKNDKFRHISVKISFLKKIHISVNIRPSYIGQYIIFNIDRYMLTYSGQKYEKIWTVNWTVNRFLFRHQMNRLVRGLFFKLMIYYDSFGFSYPGLWVTFNSLFLF